MEKRVRKPHYLMNDIIVYPIRPFKRTELTRSIPDDTLDFKSFHKFKTPRHHVTTLDKADGGKKIIFILILILIRISKIINNMI